MDTEMNTDIEAEISNNRYDVLPAAEQWQLRHGGETLSEHEWQEDAVDAGRAAARANWPSQLVVHGPDGQVAEEEAFDGELSP